MKKAALAAAAVVLVVGCTRDLELPGATAFEVSASPTTVAPRQTATVTATGGSGSLHFDFDAGGKLSGDDASLVANGDGTATYTAGQNGSTQDTLTVADSTGAVRRVIVTVGPRVSITPLVGATAPGGSLTFVASGGKAPYTFTVTPPGTGATIAVDPGNATRGLYVAGTNGDTEETVTVADATADPAAAASASVRVGTRLGMYRTATGPVAPNEEVTVVAYGGRAPYLFSPVYDPLQPATGGFKDAANGIFTVGTAGGIGVFAEPLVTDQNGQTAHVTLFVGAPLSADLASAEVRPGVVNRIQASGGKPPYTFRFAVRGNHSGGLVEQFTGTYVPGSSPGALDRLEVEDATGTVVTLADVAPVGPIELATAKDGDRCLAGDYDGDGAQDLAFLFRGMRLLEVNRVATTDPLYRSYYVGDGFRFPGAFAVDHDRNGRSDLIFAGSRSDGPLGSALGFWGLVPDMTGQFADPNNLMVTGFDGPQATALRDTGATTTYYLSSSSNGCAGSLQMVPWPDGGFVQLRTCSPTVANIAGLGGATALVAGDYSGDGLADLAWLASSNDWVYVNTWNTLGPIHVRYRSGASFIEGSSLALPPARDFEGQGNGEQNRILRVPAAAPATRDGLLVRVRDALQTGGRGTLAFASGNPLAWRFTDFDPFGGTGNGVTAIALVTPAPGGAPLVAAFAGNDGQVAVFDPWAASPVATIVSDVTFGASFGCAVDADADGYPDLAVGGEGSDLARLLWGDGAGGFGTRPHLAAPLLGASSGDLDGDGLIDLLTSDGQALTVLFGDAGQLGWSERPITSLPVASAAVAPFVDYAAYGGGVPPGTGAIVLQTIDGDYYTVRSKGDGRFDDPWPLGVGTVPDTGVPRVAHGWLLPADLGGAAFGPDLLAPENDNFGNGWVYVIRRSGDFNLIESISPAVGDYRFNTPPGLIDKTHQCAYAAVSEPAIGPTHFAVAALCSFEVPAGQPAAAWRVRGWALNDAKGGWYWDPWVDAGTGGVHAGAAGTETGVVALGTFGGKGYFVVATDRLELAVVSPGSNAFAPAGWTVTTTQLTATRRTTPYFAQTADFDGDGDRDVVVGGEGATTVLRNVGTDAIPSFQYWYEVPAAGLPIAAGPLGFVDAAMTIPERPSVVLAGLTGTGLQLLRTDGVGGLR